MNHIFHHLWATDFDALRYKLTSIAQFCTFTVTAFSVVANMLPKYENMARPKVRWIWKHITKVVAFCAFNWRKHLPGMDWHIGAMTDAPTEGTKPDDKRT